MKRLFVRAGKLGPILLLLLGVNCKGDKTAPGSATTIVANSAASISGVAGAPVSPAPSVIVRDQNGNPMGGSIVTFAVMSGGGSVTGPTATTDTTGIATVGAWTLGGAAGDNNVLTASVGSLTLSFRATGVAGAAATLAKSAGDAQVAIAGATLPLPLSVVVKDANGNVKSGVVVAFGVGVGGGSVTGGTATSNSSGVATVGGWTLGTSSGTNTLVASVAGLPSVTFNATGTVGAAGTLTKSTGDAQVATAGATLPIAPSVIVKDGNGNLKSGVVVTFAVGVGGGSVTGGSATSNASGVATVGGWTLGANPGANTLVASAAGVPSVTFTAVASSALCSVSANHTFGTTTIGTLATTDCQLPDGSFADFFMTAVPAAGAYLFREGAAFDAYLLLAFPDGTTIAENNNETETGTNSGIKALLPEGSYLFVPGSLTPGVTGDYEISSRTTSTNVGDCELVFAVKGIATDQNIAATDCLFTTAPAAPVYGDGVLIFLRAGQSVTLNMASSTIDSYLELARVARVDGVRVEVRVAQNDNKDATTKDAQITYTAVQTSYYAIFARTSVASQTGAYTLTIQ